MPSQSSPAQILKIQETIKQGDYDVTFHASEESAEDGLDILDLESAIMNGEISKMESDEPKGIRYTIIGYAVDQKRRVGVVGRFAETETFLIITAYEVME